MLREIAPSSHTSGCQEYLVTQLVVTALAMICAIEPNSGTLFAHAVAPRTDERLWLAAQRRVVVKLSHCAFRSLPLTNCTLTRALSASWGDSAGAVEFAIELALSFRNTVPSDFTPRDLHGASYSGK